MLGLKKKGGAGADTAVARMNVRPEGLEGEPELVGITADGAQLAYRVNDCPDMAVGQVVDLRVGASELGDGLVVGAVIHHRVERESDRLFDFRFLDPTGFKSQLPDDLRRLVDHRHAYRMQPDPAAPIDVSVHAPSMGIRAQAQLIDISVTGIGIAVTAGVEAELRAVNKLELSFRLPPTHQLAKVMGYVRHRRLASDGIRYGVELDERLTEDFDGCVELVRDFIRSRYQQVVEAVVRP